ncbi:head maturation protease, ClpP-related [Bradyrhizobium sp.]|uniref:head maturation protease, ClpP-related n=1 Tax=Bradyrhizobium sp. TaxID=376 RepID=UPI0039E5F48B
MRNSIKLPTDKRPSAQRQRLFARAAGAGFDVHAAGGATEVVLYDEIGQWGVSAAAFKAKLASITGDIVLKINSPGGDVFDGIAMHNDLIAHRGNVRIEVTGLAASAASIVAMAGDEIAIASNAFVMIHRAWSFTIGNTEDHTDTARLLSQIDGALAATYQQRTGHDLQQITTWMAEETWFGASEAIDAGFADEQIADRDEPKAAFDLSIYAHVPDRLKQAPRQGLNIGSRTETEQWLRSHGMSRSQAKAFTHSGYSGLSGAPESTAPSSQAAVIEKFIATVARATADLSKGRRS